MEGTKRKCHGITDPGENKKLRSNSTDYPPTAITSQWGGQTFLDHMKKCIYDAAEK
jgi:hypothetical protein